MGPVCIQVRNCFLLPLITLKLAQIALITPNWTQQYTKITQIGYNDQHKLLRGSEVFKKGWYLGVKSVLI